MSPFIRRGPAKTVKRHECRPPWWTAFIRTGSLWQCGECPRIYELSWIQGGGWGCKTWDERR